MKWRHLRQRMGAMRHGHCRRNGIRIYAYHGVVEGKKDELLERNYHLLSDFETHVRFFRQFRVLHLDEIQDEFTSTTTHHTPAVVITFDDGYANNRLAAEILERYKLPWSLFAATNLIGESKIIELIEFALLILHGNAQQVEVLDKVWPLDTRTNRELAFQAIRAELKKMPAGALKETLETIRTQYEEGETQRLLQQFPSTEMLSWDQLRQLAGAGVTIGSHGVNHGIHHKDQPISVRKSELTESKVELERQLHLPCRFFAFPNGTHMESSPEEVKEAGYELGLTTSHGTATHTSNRYLLPRMTPPFAIDDIEYDFSWQR
jgi:peptidoglycan/xylan/chitin deacetylase (PgdA/CDA1 family)